jgi:hypothetical protein
LLRSAPPAQLFADPLGISLQVQHCDDQRVAFNVAIINSKREMSRDHAMKSKVTRMNAAKIRETAKISQ